ncbi:putative peptidase [Pirellulimonas nuda]|uniref:Putative peptidase n=1 Tax=Pirellulimonas nuda TaxID=2528009 RepID=A0A518D8H3_9BACT|nr:Xaa-Pro peptidase family protein [Pirellulimonas nuda]QDU87763.1 putative peptidase [Pirellulimonas nuda]
MNPLEPRRKKLRQLVRKAKVDALLVSDPLNVTYLTGFTGDSAYLLISQDDELLVTDSRFPLQLAQDCPWLKLVVRESGQKMKATLVDVFAKWGLGKVGVEGGTMTVGEYNALSEALTDVALEPCDGLVEQLRGIKDKQEIDAVRLACDQARRAFEVVRAGLRPDMTELEAAAELEYQARKFGGRGLSFPPIIGVGPGGALPHYGPANVRFGEADFALFDWGVNSGWYVSDITRMVVTGRVTDRFRKLYNVVLEAQLTAIEAIKPGAKLQDVDAAARNVIEAAGYGKNFRHSLGHGIGLRVHEGVRLAQGEEGLLEAGMIVTVEPGVYFEGWGGIRIEDDVLVTRTGNEVLTTVPKQLEQCVLN